MEFTPDELGRRERKRKQMLEHLANTAANLFESLSYESVTMERIAEEADVAKRTLYNHFPTKEAVLAYWIDAELKRDLASLQGSIAKCKTFQSRLAYVLRASAEWCEKHPEHLMAYLRHRLLSVGAPSPPGMRSDSSDIAVAWQHLIAVGQQTGELSKAFPAEQLATWFHHLYLGALLRWLNVPGLSLENEFRSITTLFIEGASAKR
ncbi:TetR/AcrR family transcriptional regulator [Ralstonia mojiangensis]|uniref:TetR/AcrR family transcriptional regulator n=1 Tax=Ralstonia mojiangensis TaxID=2953895 RepID=UPI0021B27ACE|nr:TetR/AcrR family transcriptional regulator [Ralstonia mojiangensis]MCT7325029.1 TetR/AcrR family transcriptional regulator [Ralstonia mojiangensis]